MILGEILSKRILITGGAGFIGSHLCEKLLSNSENYIICLDNFYTGNKENIEALLKNPRFKFVEHPSIRSTSGLSICPINILA